MDANKAHREKKFGSNYIRMQRALLNKTWKQHLTKQQLYDHLPPMSQNHPFKTNKTCRTWLEKQVRTRMGHALMDPGT